MIETKNKEKTRTDCKTGCKYNFSHENSFFSYVAGSVIIKEIVL